MWMQCWQSSVLRAFVSSIHSHMHSWTLLFIHGEFVPFFALTGETRSEGGFAANKVSVASLLDVQTAKDKKGKSCVLTIFLTLNIFSSLCMISGGTLGEAFSSLVADARLLCLLISHMLGHCVQVLQVRDPHQDR